MLDKHPLFFVHTRSGHKTMPVREEPLVTGEYYHIYNRGVAKQPIFNSHRHHVRFERILNYYQDQKPSLKFSRYLSLNFQHQSQLLRPGSRKWQISIIAYSLMPNHYHLLLKQLKKNGISNFMRMVGNSYTRYYNVICNRVGPIFQGPFKAVRINSNEQLIHVSRYIHINGPVAGIDHPYSSLSQYVSNVPSSTLVVNPKIILDQFHSRQAYGKFCSDQIDYGMSLVQNKEVLIDEDN